MHLIKLLFEIFGRWIPSETAEYLNALTDAKQWWLNIGTDKGSNNKLLVAAKKHIDSWYGFVGISILYLSVIAWLNRQDQPQEETEDEKALLTKV